MEPFRLVRADENHYIIMIRPESIDILDLNAKQQHRCFLCNKNGLEYTGGLALLDPCEPKLAIREVPLPKMETSMFPRAVH
jgi:hypothetical protein